MIIGYSIIAVPTGIVSSEMINAGSDAQHTNTQVCRYCACEGHDENAKYCKKCGEILNES